MRRRAVLASAILAAACTTRPVDGPPAIRAGQDLCDGCGMTISDLRYAAAVADDVEGGPAVHLFDDLGCLVRWERAHPSAAGRRLWVHDHTTSAWLDAASARFARDERWVTPMGSGIAAFREPAPNGSQSWEQIVEGSR